MDQENSSESVRNTELMYSFYQRRSEWFQQGWTLLELVVPQEQLLFDCDWNFVGNRRGLKQDIHEVTGIDADVLDGAILVKDVDVRDRIRWIRGKLTTKPYDLIYCALEILEIKLKPDYSASFEDMFRQMQEELLQKYPVLTMSMLFNDLVCTFLAAGYPCPPRSWPSRKTEVCPRRLIDTSTLELLEFDEGQTVPPYAILSHRWQKEMSYTEYRAQEKPVSEKIHQACRKATQLGLAYIWIDTWCIDQNNAHEIAKNIESMYSYYRNSAVCLVYLFDKYIFSPDLWQSEWFRRGWTLLELLAPQEELFFDMTWTCVGSRGDMKQGIHRTTNIDTEVLDGTISFKDVDAQKKIFWIRNRFTSRPHDLAYSVLEIFDIKLDPDYSENVENTFQQMQSELLRGHPNLSPSTLFNELTCAFLATGHPVPPISWPARQVEVSAHMVLLHLSVNKLSDMSSTPH
ncbi:hypothetical protein VKT23_015304 [Stygiomarasmius scandens]|uniref:Heterokaryon incompatibility domain-containing protein n=1 Tax=Marasmiellus scandens TaxID=2682957 RepID=A0ABR1J0H5_9AGAR